MLVTVAVLTHNQIATDRRDLFEGTLESLAQTNHDFELIVVDNGSTDGTAEIVAALGGRCLKGENTWPPVGTNECARAAVASGADLCVLSDDDMTWAPGWLERLVDWWQAAPADVALTGCHLEPDFDWNTILGHPRYGRVPGLWRASTGAASWSFRAGEWFGPIEESAAGAADIHACHRLWSQGRRVAQLDLATHAGNQRSAWGNPTVDDLGWEVGPVRDRLGSSPVPGLTRPHDHRGPG